MEAGSHFKTAQLFETVQPTEKVEYREAHNRPKFVFALPQESGKNRTAGN